MWMINKKCRHRNKKRNKVRINKQQAMRKSKENNCDKE